MSRDPNPTREKILRTTWSLLEEKGAEAVRMADIAKAAKVSRQAVYLHFPTRADLLIATARFLDETFNVEDRLAPSRTATQGADRLDAWVEGWGNYIPKIAGVAAALIAMADKDPAAAAAWKDRMDAVRQGCAAAIEALVKDDQLVDTLKPSQATDLLFAIQSVPIWQNLREERGWSQEDYIAHIKHTARASLIKS
ncbi:MAG: TetR/AcrR family transcriptional regulator [Pseudomonadota bacterium]